MSDAVRCCYCSELPERRRGHGSRVQRCPLCKNEIGVTGRRRLVPHRRRGAARTRIAGSADSGLGLAAIGAALLPGRFERTAADAGRGRAVSAGFATCFRNSPRRPRPEIHAGTKTAGWPGPRPRVKADAIIEAGAAKPEGDIASLASVKPPSHPIRTATKRVGEPSGRCRAGSRRRRRPSKPSLRNIAEVRTASVSTKAELAKAR